MTQATDERRARDFEKFALSEGYSFSRVTLLKFMRAIRESDEAVGLVMVEAADEIERLRAALAASPYAKEKKNANKG